jgi:hypothetical protein
MSQRKSSRVSRKPDRFDPNPEKWIPGSSNGNFHPDKIDHWQLRYNGNVKQSKAETKNDEKYEEKIIINMIADKFSEKDRNFVVDDTEQDYSNHYISCDEESEFETDEETDEEYGSAHSWKDDDSEYVNEN